ncbi:uncharacterized protein LOC117110203 [Anneissia japonica]|uniref:uncharacterized protein LOC117110203 n=1 Tax=Anneissia japonica TaxID=1529436 RepID=UPI0014258F6B|nr:uncharacterized protein LOC117110203 [Anneissia japonica]
MAYFSINITALITFLATVAVLSSFRCERGWNFYEKNCYLLTNIKTNWTNNKIFCEERNASLTSIHNDSENKFVAKLCSKSNNNRYCYIGLRKANQSANFSWIDGSNSTYIWPPWKKHNKNISEDKDYVVSIDANTTNWLRNKQHRPKNSSYENRNAVCKQAAIDDTTDTSTTIIYEYVTTTDAEKLITTAKSTTGAEITKTVKSSTDTSTTIIYEYVTTTTGAEKLITTEKSTTGAEITTTKTKTAPDNFQRYTLDDLLNTGRKGKPKLHWLILAASTNGIDQSLLDWVPPGKQNQTILKYLSKHFFLNIAPNRHRSVPIARLL